MIKIGILGEIGSGKSFVAKKFKFPVFSADEEVTRIYKKNKLCFLKLKKKFPKFIKKYPIDKKELGQAVLCNKNNLKNLIGYTDDPIVSSDVIGREETMVFDAKATMLTADELLKTLCWYDYGWGCSKRILDTIRLYETGKGI